MLKKATPQRETEEMRQRMAINLGILRRRRGLTQAELAGALGVSQSAISAYERAASYPTPEHRLALAQALGVPVEIIEGSPSFRLDLKKMSPAIAPGQFVAERERGALKIAATVRRRERANQNPKPAVREVAEQPSNLPGWLQRLKARP
jgi:transcriptional regulator with XRE-family HTH domain